MLKVVNHPYLLMLLAMLPPLGHLVLHLVAGLPMTASPSTTDELSSNLVTAASVMAAVAGVVVVFLVSERGAVFRRVRKSLGETYAAQTTALVACPALAMVAAIAAAAVSPAMARVALAEWSIILLIVSVGYELAFLHTCVAASATQDREDASSETLAAHDAEVLHLHEVKHG